MNSNAAEVRGADERRREAMIAAAHEVVDIASGLAEAGTNVVNEILKNEETFAEWEHYPKGDIYDADTGAQYYYHSHDGTAEEHGHFHTFLRAIGMPDGIEPVPHEGTDAVEWPAGEEALSHLVAIRMDHHGVPTHLFTTNRWVTGETFYPADTVIRMLDRFEVRRLDPSPSTNRWIGAMLSLFRPEIERLLRERDAAIAARAQELSGTGHDVFEDRTLEVASSCAISISDQLERLGLLE